jgi:hypothetical protein
MLQLSLRGHSVSPAYLIRVALPKITPHLEYGSQYWASKLTQTQASKLCSFKDTTVRHLLRLHTRYTASFPINYSPGVHQDDVVGQRVGEGGLAGDGVVERHTLTHAKGPPNILMKPRGDGTTLRLG